MKDLNLQYVEVPYIMKLEAGKTCTIRKDLLGIRRLWFYHEGVPTCAPLREPGGHSRDSVTGPLRELQPIGDGLYRVVVPGVANITIKGLNQ